MISQLHMKKMRLKKSIKTFIQLERQNWHKIMDTTQKNTMFTYRIGIEKRRFRNNSSIT